MNSGMISTGAPIVPMASEGLSIKIKSAFEKHKNKKEKVKNGDNNIK